MNTIVENVMVSIEKIEKFVVEAHQGQTDKLGEPYWKHPFSVRALLPFWATDEMHAAALLHDICEDTEFSLKFLFNKFNFSYEVLKIIWLLTRPKKMTYANYISRLKNSDDVQAIVVKICDLKHNLDHNRLSKLDKETQKRLKKKYLAAYDELHSNASSISKEYLENQNKISQNKFIQMFSYIDEIKEKQGNLTIEEKIIREIF